MTTTTDAAAVCPKCGASGTALQILGNEGQLKGFRYTCPTESCLNVWSTRVHGLDEQVVTPHSVTEEETTVTPEPQGWVSAREAILAFFRANPDRELRYKTMQTELIPYYWRGAESSIEPNLSLLVKDGLVVRPEPRVWRLKAVTPPEAEPPNADDVIRMPQATDSGMTQELSGTKNQEDKDIGMHDTYVQEQLLPATISGSLGYVMGNAQYQAASKSDARMGDYFDGYCAGMATAIGIICAGLGYSVPFLDHEALAKKEKEHANTTGA